ncbi:MAG: DUF4426 domain-containing protein [Gammaproteobacteria bacterium]|nr:DUF4426 domain-containing protein [Gammaproteobacteria bacterium]
MSTALSRSIALASSLFSLAAGAEQVQIMGDYKVHYNAFNSTFLSQAVATQYGLTRSKLQGVINIAVQKPAAGKDVPVTANLRGLVKNDIGQGKELEIREIKDGQAIYYIASFSHGDNEKLDFEIAVQGEGRGEVKILKFSQLFFAD